MDGYTFMLARNRRLIAAEAAVRTGSGTTPPEVRRQTDRPTDGERALRDDVVALYRKIEACGR